MSPSMDRPSPAQPRNGTPQSEPIEGLLPEQLVAATSIALPRAHPRRRVRVLLWALRVLLFTLTALVVFVFVRGL
jgi:hypothetical protein